jgi:RNA polymerase sigma-70 factor, ECF subfamily
VSSPDGLAPATWAVLASDQAHRVSAGDLSDEELMSRVKAGDQAAFAVLMRRNARAVLAVGRRVLHDQGSSEELVQDVFLLVYRRCQLFDPHRGSFRAWVIQIAYNEAYRSRQRLSLRHIYEDQTIAHAPDPVTMVTSLFISST